MKKIVTFSLLLCFLSLTTPAVSAHPSGVSCFLGSELLGYVVDCNNHQSSSTFNYNATGLDATYLGYTTTGASSWSGTVTINSSFSILAQGYYSTYSDPDTSTVAAFYDYSSNSSGHLTTWRIKNNKSKMDGRTASANNGTAAHELGHAIGLNDLYGSPNSGKLMYGYSTRTTTVPTSSDITGATEATK
ncbi:hypothetical protein [Paenibacillus sp. PAMC21692]|uniref:hypothetical protein n=1 Tax=Paenibacillus sp. PAMC21692 TaxID=2762320 RepID=UPI00164EA65C|nr:hypothetical protein [Paenibacillus sp. PAMC21692]QNK57709.1 hypothetical protein H7F31_01700 [Paenibacillus sp. PAMC21692]